MLILIYNIRFPEFVAKQLFKSKTVSTIFQLHVCRASDGGNWPC